MTVNSGAQTGWALSDNSTPYQLTATSSQPLQQTPLLVLFIGINAPLNEKEKSSPNDLRQMPVDLTWPAAVEKKPTSLLLLPIQHGIPP